MATSERLPFHCYLCDTRVGTSGMRSVVMRTMADDGRTEKYRGSLCLSCVDALTSRLKRLTRQEATIHHI